MFAHEQAAATIEAARRQSRTRYFWWINYLTDYTDFDFLFEPVPWEAEYTHTWPSQHHRYSGTFLVPRDNTTIEYRFHDQILPNRDNRNNYNIIKDNIRFDYTWAPDPFDPPYRYIFGNQWYPANRMPTVEYRVAGAEEIKYISTPRAELKDNKDNNWTILIECEFDYSWVPDPGDPPYRYIFGNQWHRAEIMPTVEYTVEGATEIKYMHFPRANLIKDLTRWTIPENTNQAAFDFSWVPDPGSPPYIYQFGTQWNRAGGPVYSVPGAQDIKYTTQQTARMLPTDLNWAIPEGIDINSFDFSWTPDTTEQPYIYQFGTQWQKTGGPRYTVPGAQEIKYITTP